MTPSCPPRPTWAEIDLQALKHNLVQLRSFCAKEQGLLAVVKADAYGHGAVPISRALVEEGISYLGVATLEEGLELRQAGIPTPVLVLGGCYPGQESAFLAHSLTPAVFSLADLQRLDRFAVAQGMRLPVHLKCDTGMGRVGFLPHEVTALLEWLKGAGGVQVEGLMSHLACADEPGSLSTREQVALFRTLVVQLRDGGIRPEYVHLANSAGLVAWDLPECNLARPGIALYGGAPLASGNDKLNLRPVMSFSTRIAQLRSLDAGAGVSYGHTHHTRRKTLLATLPVGYADGYNRLFSDCGSVLIRGTRAPLIGRVCMDWIMVDVTDVDGVEIGDRAVLLGRDGEEEVSAADWAQALKTIDYEVFCRIGQRVPRHYVNASAH